MNSSTPRHALVLGGSGPIGAAVLDLLRERHWEITAISRQAPADASDGVRWLRGEFAAMPALPARVDALISAGPLDHFAHWYAHSDIDCPRVIAFGSTSVEVKRKSADPQERDLAERLRAGEEAVFARARERGAAATLLRPTLVYGSGRDRNLSRIAALARKQGFFLLPNDANGRRQPVHVQDLAQAAVAVIDAEVSAGRAYALPGGEAMAYREMVRRLLRTMQPSPRLVSVPTPLFRLALVAARALGRVGGFNEAMLARLREDLVFDAEPARRDFGYAPRGFDPDPSWLP